MIRFIALALMLSLAPAQAEEVVAALSQDRIAITASFDGSEIVVYGAVKREEPIPPEAALQVIVTVEGPSSPVMVRRKAKRFGIWLNTDAVEVDLAPSFYAVATTGPFNAVLSQTEDLRYAVSVPRAIRSVGAPMTIQDAQAFSEALIRIRTGSGLYGVHAGDVSLAEHTLFRVELRLPANLTEGSYKTRIFLTRNLKVVDLYEAAIDVRKEGLERFLFNLAHEQPLIYGLLSLILAIAAGWGASAAFRLIRT